MMGLGFETGPLKNPNNCTDSYTPSFWLGKPGALTQIRMADAGIARSLSDHFAVHDLLDGQAVDRSPYGCRTWTFTHEWLKPDVMSVFMEYATRQRGIGPFILIDPQMKNLLTPNQASGTDALHTTEGFAVSGTGSALSSSTLEQVQGERSLMWTLTPPVTGSANVMRVVTPTGLYGFCIPSSKVVAFSGWVKAGSAPDPSVQVSARLVYMNGVGAVQSTVIGPIIITVTGSSGWQSFCITGIGGTYIEPQFIVTGGSVSAQAKIHFDQLQLEITDVGTCTQWEYGQGQPLVGVRNDGETVPRILRTTMNYIAMEVT